MMMMMMTTTTTTTTMCVCVCVCVRADRNKDLIAIDETSHQGRLPLQLVLAFACCR